MYMLTGAGNDVVHVNTGNPIGVYSTTRNGPVYFTDLSSFYPSSGRLKTECMGLPGGHFLHFSANVSSAKYTDNAYILSRTNQINP